MKQFVFTASIAAACLALGACGGGSETNTADANVASDTGVVTEMENGGDNASGAAAAGASASATFPRGARIVEEGGVTYRVDADGTRVRLGDSDARIVVENGVRYRVDPGGTRVRINPEGAAIDIDLPDIDAPDVDIGINNKGNPDVDVKAKSDGDSGPN
jgi:hypothetical protein